jgi:SAM-dependent methyltransferase
MDILELKVQQNVEANDITFVDLGYGRGRALIDLSEYPPLQNKVRLVGIGPPAHSKLWVESVDGQKFPPTYEKLVSKGVRLVDQNIVRINEVMLKSSADVVAAAFSLYSIQYPSWEIIKKIYAVLKPGGVFVSTDACPIPLGHDPYFLAEYLTQLGYPFEVHNTEEPFRDMIWRFSMQKTLPELPNTISPCEAVGRHMVSINI